MIGWKKFDYKAQHIPSKELVLQCEALNVAVLIQQHN